MSIDEPLNSTETPAVEEHSNYSFLKVSIIILIIIVIIFLSISFYNNKESNSISDYDAETIEKSISQVIEKPTSCEGEWTTCSNLSENGDARVSVDKTSAKTSIWTFANQEQNNQEIVDISINASAIVSGNSGVMELSVSIDGGKTYQQIAQINNASTQKEILVNINKKFTNNITVRAICNNLQSNEVISCSINSLALQKSYEIKNKNNAINTNQKNSQLSEQSTSSISSTSSTQTGGSGGGDSSSKTISNTVQPSSQTQTSYTNYTNSSSNQNLSSNPDNQSQTTPTTTDQTFYCIDSDDGINYNIEGLVITNNINGVFSGINSYLFDFCFNNGTTSISSILYERYCDGTSPKDVLYNCKNGCVPINTSKGYSARCILDNETNQNPTTPSNNSTSTNEYFETDNGNNSEVAGAITYNGIRLATDSCVLYSDPIPSQKISEAYLDNGFVSWNLLPCKYGCEMINLSLSETITTMAGRCRSTSIPCIDTDAGVDYSVKGNIKLGSWNNTDSCYIGSYNSSGQYLYEYYCDSNNFSQINYHFCVGGCQDGACINPDIQVDTSDGIIYPNTILCTDTDSGDNPFTAGIVTWSNYKNADTCYSSGGTTGIGEFYCTGPGMYYYKTHPCKNGCEYVNISGKMSAQCKPESATTTGSVITFKAIWQKVFG